MNAPALRVPEGVAIPDRIARLPRDHRGFPIPYFVPPQARGADGVVDFRFVDSRRIVDVVKRLRCHICGEALGKFLTFVIGPMCAINRISSEPPAHRDCAIFAAQVCPFLARPRMRRNKDGIDYQHQKAIGPGIMLERNPGVALVYVTSKATMFRDKGGFLFQLDPPTETLWFCEGRPATRAEVDASVAGGMPFLEKEAALQGAAGLAELAKLVKAAEPLWPRATP